MDDDTKIAVEVAVAWPNLQRLVKLEVSPGTTAIEAVRQSGLIEAFAIDIETLTLGIFGRVVEMNAPVTAGDRVEIYRPLHMDPREARRQRAAATNQLGSTGTSRNISRTRSPSK